MIRFHNFWHFLLFVFAICCLIYLFGIGFFEQETGKNIGDGLVAAEFRPFHLFGKGGGLAGFLAILIFINVLSFGRALFIKFTRYDDGRSVGYCVLSFIFLVWLFDMVTH